MATLATRWDVVAVDLNLDAERHMRCGKFSSVRVKQSERAVHGVFVRSVGYRT